MAHEELSNSFPKRLEVRTYTQRENPRWQNATQSNM